MVKIISSKYFIRMFCKWHILDTECGLCALGCPLGDLWLLYKEWLWKKKLQIAPCTFLTDMQFGLWDSYFRKGILKSARDAQGI